MHDKTLQQIQTQIEAKLPPNDHDAYRRIVVAGMKVMFDESTFADIFNSFNAERPVPSLVNGVLGLGVLLMKKSKGTMPVPAAIAAMNTLMLHAMDFLGKAGKLQITPELVAEATTTFLETVMQKMGMNQQTMGKIVQQTQQAAMQAKG